SFVAEEATSAIRHDVRGKLSSVRNGAFYVRRKLEGLPAVLEGDPRLLKFLEMIDAEMAALGEVLVSRLPPPDKASLPTADPLEVANQMVRAVAPPPGLTLELQPSVGARV